MGLIMIDYSEHVKSIPYLHLKLFAFFDVPSIVILAFTYRYFKTSETTKGVCMKKVMHKIMHMPWSTYTSHMHGKSRLIVNTSWNHAGE